MGLVDSGRWRGEACLDDAEAGAGSVGGGEVEGGLPVGDVEAGDLGGCVGGVGGRQEGDGDECGLHFGCVSKVVPFCNSFQ